MTSRGRLGVREWVKGRLSRSTSRSGGPALSEPSTPTGEVSGGNHRRQAASGSLENSRISSAISCVSDNPPSYRNSILDSGVGGSQPVPLTARSASDIQATNALSPTNLRHHTAPIILEPSNVITGGMDMQPGDPAIGTTNDAFQMALQKHVQRLTAEEQKAFLLGNNISPEKLLADVQDFDNQHSQISTSRKCASKVKGFLDVFNVYLNALGMCIQHSPEISSLVVGGIQLVVDLGRRFVEFFEWLTDTISSLGEHLSYLAEYARMHGHHQKVKEAVCAVYGDLLEFCSKVRGVFTDKDGNLDRYVSAKVAIGSWPTFQSDIEAIKSRFKERIEIVMRTVVIEEQKRLHAKELLEDAEKENRERGELLLWLSTLEFDSDHDRIYKKRHGDTGKWLLESDPFNTWLDDQKSCLLWCHGNPGVGKSVLTSIVLEEVRVKHDLNERVGMGFVYFNNQSQEAQKPGDILSTLIKQLCHRMKVLPNQLKDIYKKYRPQGQRPSIAVLEKLLLEIADNFEQIFLVFDAMDEYNKEHRTEFLSYLVKLSRQSQNRFKVFVASRKERDIENTFVASGCLTIEVKVEEVDEDIAKFVRHWIYSRPDEHNLCAISERIKKKIEDTLLSKSNGMFVWVQYQLAYIYEQPCQADIEEALESLPEDLNAMYLQILRKIDRQAPAMKLLAKRTFMWVFSAMSPLQGDFLAIAVAIEPAFDGSRELKQYEIKTLMSACGNLLTIDNNKLVRPIHYTVKEFFTLPAPSATKDNRAFIEEYHILEMEASAELARSYLQYILFYSKIDYNADFVNHACRSWDFHLRPLEAVPDDLSTILATLLSSESSSAIWLINNIRGIGDIMKQQDALSFCLAFDLLPVYLKFHELGSSSTKQVPGDVMVSAAIGGSVASIEKLLILGYPIDSVGSEEARPLYYAAREGHQEAVKFLIGKGSSINALGGSYGYPLAAAAHYGREIVVEFLIENGADINAQGGEYGNALQAATCGESENTVQKLLEHGADVNTQGGEYGNALQAACYCGNERIAQMILEHGANVNAQGGQYGNALQAASFDGSEKIVEMLLERGANVNAQGGNYGNALQAASFDGSEKIVEIILEHGADVNAQGGEYGNALQAACCGRNERIVQILLERGADVGAQGGYFGNALQAASYGRNEKIVQILLEHGADTNTQGGVYGSALQAASYDGSEKIIQVLLEHGANVNAQGGRFGNALQAACLYENENIAEILLEHGANVNAQGGKYGNALQAACCGRNVKIVEILLGHGADVNAQGGEYGNALQAASCRRNEKMVQILLEHGADVNAQGGQYGNALQAATCGDNESTVQILLEHGTDVNTQGGEYGNALQAACFYGNEKIVQMILDHGADVNAQGGKYGSAISAAVDNEHNYITKLLRENGAIENSPA